MSRLQQWAERPGSIERAIRACDKVLPVIAVAIGIAVTVLFFVL